MNWIEDAPNKRPEILLHATKSQMKKFTLSSPSAMTAESDPALSFVSSSGSELLSLVPST